MVIFADVGQHCCCSLSAALVGGHGVVPRHLPTLVHSPVVVGAAAKARVRKCIVHHCPCRHTIVRRGHRDGGIAICYAGMFAIKGISLQVADAMPLLYTVPAGMSLRDNTN